LERRLTEARARSDAAITPDDEECPYTDTYRKRDQQEKDNEVLSRLGGDRLQRTKRQSHSEWKAGRREAAEEVRQQKEMRREMLQKVKEAAEQRISMMRQGPEPMPRSKVKCRRMVGGMRKKKDGRGKWSVEQEEPRSLQAARRVLSAVPLLYVVCTRADGDRRKPSDGGYDAQGRNWCDRVSPSASRI